MRGEGVSQIVEPEVGYPGPGKSLFLRKYDQGKQINSNGDKEQQQLAVYSILAGDKPVNKIITYFFPFIGVLFAKNSIKLYYLLLTNWLYI